MAASPDKRAWWEFIPLVGAIGRLMGTTKELVSLSFELIAGLVRGEMDEDFWERFWAVYKEVVARANDVYEVITYSMLLAASMAVSQIELSLQSGKLSTLLDTRIGAALFTTYNWVNQIKGKVEKEVERIKGELDWAAIDSALNHLQIAHNVGLTFSSRYRDAVEDFYRNTADLSRQVFGPANSLFHGLSLLQLVINDTARLNGRTAADGQAEYLTSATNASRRVADKSRAYARDGSVFWADFQTIYIQPQINSQYQGAIQRDSLIGTIDTTAKAARKSVQSVSDGFRDYRQHLAPFLSDENIKELREIQTGFDQDIRRPVIRFQRFMDETFPNIEEVTEQLAKDNLVLAEGVLVNLDRTAYPGSLTEEKKADQGLRFNSIMDSAFVRGDGAPRSIQRDMIIVRSIYDILEDR